MRVLILGGTRFLGRAVAEALLERSHEVTLFHRGKSNPSILPEVHHVLGDRRVDLDRLRGRRFDAVVDTSAYEVQDARLAIQHLAHPALHYVLVSSISVYEDLGNMDETGPVSSMDGAETAALTGASYGPLKVACERALEKALPGRVLTVRAGVIVGPHDTNTRFRSWLKRIHEGGDVLAPGNPEAPRQLIDVRDLATWMVERCEQRTAGVLNACGDPMTSRAMLEGIKAVVGGEARFVWAPDEVLERHGVELFSGLPYWLPDRLGTRPVPIERAKRLGLRCRPFAETVRDTWSWLQTGWDAEAAVRAHPLLPLPVPITSEEERAILADLAAP